MKSPDDFAWKSWPLPADPEIDMFEWQDDRCARCSRSNVTRRLVLDHCHMTGLVRGYLCSSCNSAEGWGGDEIWGGWRTGDNPANALGQYEIYRNHMGATPVSSQGEIHWYSHEERIAWFTLAPERLAEGMPWPEDVPSLATSAARRDAAYLHLQTAMDGWFTFGKKEQAS